MPDAASRTPADARHGPAAGGWRVAGGGWRLAAAGSRLAARGWRLAAAVLVAAIALVQVPALAADEQRLHAIPGTPLHVALPADWVVAPPRGGAVLVLRSPPLAGPIAPGDESAAAAADRRRGALAAVLRPLTAATGNEAFARACFADLARLTPDWAEVEAPAATTIHGRTWWRARYRFATGQLTWEQIAVAGVLPGAPETGLCLTCSTASDRFATWLPAFEAAIASLGRPGP